MFPEADGDMNNNCRATPHGDKLRSQTAKKYSVLLTTRNIILKGLKSLPVILPIPDGQAIL